MSEQLARIAARAQASNTPLTVMLELTGRCNLDCQHCYLDIAHPPREMSTEQALSIIDQIAQAGALFLTLTGGELFLRKDALIVAQHARDRGLAVRLLTNATRIDRALAARIAKVNPLAVEISVYAANAAGHDRMTQRRRSWRKTLRGVLLLKRVGVRVGIKAPLLGLVAAEIDELYHLADRLKVPISLDPFVTPRHDGGRRPIDLRADTESLAAALLHPRLKDSSGRNEPQHLDEAPCAIASRTCRITPQGDLFPCPTYPEAAGNLFEHSFDSLWSRSPLLNRLRAIRVRDLQGDCAGCGQSGYCGRCMAVARIEHDNEMGPSKESCRIAAAKDLAADPTFKPPANACRLRIIS